MKRGLATLAIVLMVVSTSAVTSPIHPASAFNYRDYSDGIETNYAFAITGFSTFHAYAPLSITPGSFCNTPFNNASNFVAFDQWMFVHLSNQFPDQLEMGYAEQCSNQNFLFTAIWQNNAFTVHSVDWLVPPDGINAHQFCFVRGPGSPDWHFRFDTPGCAGPDSYPPFTWSVAGERVQAGIESSDSSVVVPAHWFSTMQLQHDEAAWVNWGANGLGTVQQYVDPIPPMCGRYPGYPSDVTRYSAAENSSC